MLLPSRDLRMLPNIQINRDLHTCKLLAEILRYAFSEVLCNSLYTRTRMVRANVLGIVKAYNKNIAML